jgi:hypothetical protein
VASHDGGSRARHQDQLVAQVLRRKQLTRAELKPFSAPKALERDPNVKIVTEEPGAGMYPLTSTKSSVPAQVCRAADRATVESGPQGSAQEAAQPG